jgi:hypothetical protein
MLAHLHSTKITEASELYNETGQCKPEFISRGATCPRKRKKKHYG